jgi:hypothetical protein
MNLKQSFFIRINILLLRPVKILLDKLSNVVWYNNPLGERRKYCTKEIYLNLARNVRDESYPEIEKYENNIGFSIDKMWLDDLALHTQITIKKSKLCYAHGRVVYTALSGYLAKQINHQKKQRITILETGTARGFSSLCMAKALSDQNRYGLIITYDFLPHLKKMYWNCIDDNDGPKTRAELLSKWKDLMQNYIIYQQGDTRLELNKLQLERINFAFLDGAHTFNDVMNEFQKIKTRQVSGDVIVYDDYTKEKFSGIVRAVNEICINHDYKRIDLKSSDSRGYVITEKK